MPLVFDAPRSKGCSMYSVGVSACVSTVTGRCAASGIATRRAKRKNAMRFRIALVYRLVVRSPFADLFDGLSDLTGLARLRGDVLHRDDAHDFVLAVDHRHAADLRVAHHSQRVLDRAVVFDRAHVL